MKILFSSYHNPFFITITEYMENAIEALDHELFRFDDRHHIFPGRLRYRLKFFNDVDLKFINKKFLSLALDIRPDMAIVAGGNRINAGTIKKLRANGITTVLWTTDAPIVFQPILDVAPFYDHIFCQGTEAVEILTNAGIKKVNWLPVACDQQLHQAINIPNEERAKFAKDVVFVGSFYQNRWEILKELGDFNIGIWGPGWRKIGKSPNNIRTIDDVKLNYEKWIKIYSGAKIIVVIHYNDGATPCYQASPKVFEALACKKLILVDNQKDVFQLFGNKRHLVRFNDIKDLKEKIAYYLNNHSAREKIASEGYKEVIKKHTYLHRIKKLIEIATASKTS